MGREPTNPFHEFGIFLSEQVVRAILSVAGFLATIGIIRGKTRNSDAPQCRPNSADEQ